MNKSSVCSGITAITLLLLLISCTPSYYYSSELNIPNGIWESKKAAIFEPEFNDTTQSYNIILSVSNSDDYRYSNIWFFLKTISPDGFSHKDTLEVILAEEDGKWFGEKSRNSWTYQFYFKKQVRFPKTGKYTFEIIQGMRDVELRGITKVGLLFEENNEN